MTRVVKCPECDTREREGFMHDGECRDCRGINVSTRIRGQRSRPLSWNDREALSHREAENRARVLRGNTNE